MMAALPQIDANGPGLVDACGRTIDHLRVSVTSACELRCIYCRPQVRIAHEDQELSDQQRLELIRFLHERYGLAQVRITGGEPLLYPRLVSLVAALHRTVPDVGIAMTTNGRRLPACATALRSAGLQRLNISLDALDAQRYRQITGGSLEDALAGIAAARSAGFPPPKINTVVLRGVNERELVALTEWSYSQGSEIRFLEAMPIGAAAEVNRRGFVPGAEVLDRLSESFNLTPIQRRLGETAQRYHAVGKNGAGYLGLIAPISEPFCNCCRRIRLTADGRLFPCLLDSQFVDLHCVWHNGKLCRETAAALIEAAAAIKQPEGPQRQTAAMVTLGG